ncbi:hypothetical protein OG819_42775 [Streptomyces sp. NBC_01549]|uniref:hypothetical protein n=1 Tax=Streptomyces sp. NBC_01549 TaxID=2975874 RepID=UPI0022579372|nr:hypothetical protein [Streptomyces sp. NBC_01549]MCX4596142.1 hypothetical protein [Streptomyces sp. NBC_01549]
MAFGNGDLLRQISNQLGQVLTDLAAVKQQLADQQHAIDQIRFDTTAAINTGLTENRAVIRDGLTRANETISDPLTQIGSELVAIRGGIGQLDNQIRTAAAQSVQRPAPEPEPVPVEDQASPSPEPDPVPEPEPEKSQLTDDDLKTLRAAAGISAATLHAHRDTWEFLVKHAGPDRHFHVPGEVQDAVGTVLAKISGPSLVAVLTSLGSVKDDPAADPGTRAIAHHLHERIGNIVNEIAAAPHSGGDVEPVKIVIDDRLKPEDDQPPADED